MLNASIAQRAQRLRMHLALLHARQHPLRAAPQTRIPRLVPSTGVAPDCHISAPIHPPTRKVCLQVVLPAHAAHKEELQLIIRGTLRCRQQCCPRLQGRRSQQGELSHHHSKAGVP